MIRNFSFLMMLLFSVNTHAQSIHLFTSGTKASFRGLSVVDDQTIWVSGSNGTILKSTDAGESWKFLKVEGYEKTDFRDIEAFDEKTAIIMGIDSPGVILKTTDGGNSWKLVFKDDTKGMFLDAMEFMNSKHGVVIGDPIEGRFFMAKTKDGGDHWKVVPFQKRPVADNGEACFASSGTNVRKLVGNQSIFVSGGLHSNLFINDQKISLPIVKGKETTGANSIAIKNKKYFVIAGGDFTQKDSIQNNLIITKDAGKNWILPKVSPHGYRSCVEYIGGDIWITCGLNGVDISTDNGNNFSLISETGFHVCRKAKNGNAIFFAGGNGRIGKLVK